jgi:hypothetical protein
MGLTTKLPYPFETVDFLASTPFETPPEEGGSGRMEKSSILKDHTVRAEENFLFEGRLEALAASPSTPSFDHGSTFCVSTVRTERAIDPAGAVAQSAAESSSFVSNRVNTSGSESLHSRSLGEALCSHLE